METQMTAAGLRAGRRKADRETSGAAVPGACCTGDPDVSPLSAVGRRFLRPLLR